MKKILIYFILLTIIFTSCTKKVNNSGNLTIIGSGEDEIKVIVVKGSPYEMGFQLGSILKDDIRKCLDYFVDAAKKDHPEIISDKILDKAWETLLPKLDQRLLDELKGISDGSGIDYKSLCRMQTIPVISDYACSGVDIWGSSTINNHLYQIRNLDFTTKAYLQDFPVLVIYKPDNGLAHYIATFAGYIAVHSGMNEKGIVLGEKGESPHKEYPFNYDGEHFSFLFKRLLYDMNTLDETVTEIKNADLIKRYYLYIGDGKEESMGAAKIKVTSPDSIKKTIWVNNDPTDEMAPNIANNTLYYTAKNEIAFPMIKDNLGKFDHNTMIELSKAVARGDNLLNIVYDATTLEMWVAYATSTQNACEREYVHINLKNY